MAEVVPIQTAPLLQLHDVTVQRGGRALLSHINFELTAGQILTVIGPNGAGKSTLAKTALGLIEPDSGEVRRAKDTTVGYVPQHLTIDPTLPITVRRFLKLACRGAGCLSPEDALKHTQVGHLINDQVQTLSGGELRRVLLARALLRQPKLLVLDEPDQGLDVLGRNELYQLISRIAQELSCGVLMISHDLHLVMSVYHHEHDHSHDLQGGVHDEHDHHHGHKH